MGVNLKRKRGSPAMEVVMVMVALVLLINTNSCVASFVLKSNVTSYRQCITTGAMHGCLIADDLDLGFDFFMDTQVVRILGDEGSPGTGTAGTSNPDRSACPPGVTGDPSVCNPNKRETHPGGCGNKYSKPCHQ